MTNPYPINRNVIINNTNLIDNHNIYNNLPGPWLILCPAKLLLFKLPKENNKISNYGLILIYKKLEEYSIFKARMKKTLKILMDKDFLLDVK